MSKWKCEVCGNEFENFHAQGFDNKIYCHLCFFKRENQALKKQLEEYKATNEVLSHELTKDKVLQQDCLTTCCGIPIGDIPKLITQQKEFIEYMNKTIEELEYDDVDDEEMKGYLIQRIDTFKEILQKYRSIIGCDKVE